ncbi:M15 family metallopeptidase [Neomicrococcus aestuarii]|uniref:M15 family metallopeptidase n=1 Tax=Neomicrococcus aestuarii TaxID=556325 RepID=UPI000A070ADE|nr:M15 family metallopeptidase [Neomicrococcus aestuarii]
MASKRRARYRKDAPPSLPLKLTQRGLVVIAVLVLVVGGALTAAITMARNNAVNAAASQAASSSAASPTTKAATETAAASSSSQKADLDPATMPESEDPLLMLVRKDRPLKPLDFTPKNLVSLAPGKTLIAEAATQFEKLLAGGAAAGHSLRIESGYRSYTAQENLFNRYVQKYGTAYAEKISARPGTSEHQTGLAADIGLSNGECSLHRCFGDTTAGQWVAQNATDYGFIIRYPDNQAAATGYNYEPWHLRYIGVDQAKAFAKSGAKTLEEFLTKP